MSPSGSEPVEIEIAGRTLAVSSPDKVFFDDRGETKLDLVRYYLAVEVPLMATMGGRPVLLQCSRTAPPGRRSSRSASRTRPPSG